MNDVYIPRGYKKKMDRSHIFGIEVIFKVVEEYFGIDRETLKAKSKKTTIVYPRQVCQWLMWKYSIQNARGIGLLFDQCDNTCCVNSVKAIDDYIDTDFEVKNQIAELEARLKETKNEKE